MKKHVHYMTRKREENKLDDTKIPLADAGSFVSPSADAGSCVIPSADALPSADYLQSTSSHDPTTSTPFKKKGKATLRKEMLASIKVDENEKDKKRKGNNSM